MKNKTPDQIKEIVKKQYAAIAHQDKEQNESSCCGSSCCSPEVHNIMSDDYTKIEGYNPEADLGLGCGLPTQFAHIRKGDVVVDLGAGAGNDCFIARHETGPEGKVIGIDFTEAMIDKARLNAEKLNYHNVEFRQGDIESMPVTSDSADVIVSNCVLNLVPDKTKAYQEVYRTLKPGGHFSISDVVINHTLPDKLLEAAEMYAGCISGAMSKDQYISIIKECGFKNVFIQQQKPIVIPGDILAKYLSEEEIFSYTSNQPGIWSITVYGEKDKNDCCDKKVCCN